MPKGWTEAEKGKKWLKTVVIERYLNLKLSIVLMVNTS